MFDSKALIKEVAFNCSVTDARNASMFSVCGLALRFRGLYKWEKGIAPWEEEDPKKLLAWIDRKENSWDSLVLQDFRRIPVNGKTFDPFDAERINAALLPSSMVYGAGYSHGLVPTFFLGRLTEIRKVLGCPVFILGKELARDLMAAPALSEEGTIYIRKTVIESFLWDQMLFINRSGKKALESAMKRFKVTSNDTASLKKAFPEIVESETDAFIYHETGEILDSAVDRDLWREILIAFPHTVIELLARSLKDLLADTGPFGRLAHIIDARKTTSLSFFVAFLDGFRKALFPEMILAYERFLSDPNWKIIEEAMRDGYAAAGRRADTLFEIFQSGREQGDMDRVEKEIRGALLHPLGLG